MKYPVAIIQPYVQTVKSEIKITGVVRLPPVRIGQVLAPHTKAALDISKFQRSKKVCLDMMIGSQRVINRGVFKTGIIKRKVSSGWIKYTTLKPVESVRCNVNVHQILLKDPAGERSVVKRGAICTRYGIYTAACGKRLLNPKAMLACAINSSRL